MSANILRYDVAVIEPMCRNKTNSTYLLANISDF